MKYTDESSTNSRNMSSEEAYMNTSRILLEVPRSRLPYERFRVDVALQVGGKVGPFVSDDTIHGKHVQNLFSHYSYKKNSSYYILIAD